VSADQEIWRPSTGSELSAYQEDLLSVVTPTARQQVSCGTAHECGCGLIFGLIRLRSPTFIDIQINAATQLTDMSDIQRTIIPSPENRKVSCSTTAR
jgi:hypothetical protein